MNDPYLVDGRPPHRVGVLRALPGLGDFLCVVPALRALRAALPQAEVVLIAPDSVAPIVGRMGHLVDGLLPFPGYPGIVEGAGQTAEVMTFLSRAQEQAFDLVLQMHGNGTISNPLAVLIGGRATAGFFLPGMYCPDPLRFLPYPSLAPEILRHLALMTHLGIPSRGVDSEFPLAPEDLRQANDVLGEHQLKAGGYAVVHPGATAPERRWEPHAFATVAEHLQSRGLKVVLTGVLSEAGITQAVQKAMKASPVDLTGRTNLGTLAAVVAQARIVLCNDTGVSHLAAALRVPSVVVFAGSITTGSDPARWAPLDSELHRAVFVDSNLDEKPCDTPDRVVLDNRWREHRCLGDACTVAARAGSVERPPARVPVELVLAQVNALLDG